MRRRRGELAFQEEWGDLAIYNSEVARGIVHTPEWDAKMAERQARYNRWAFDNAVYGTARIDGDG